MEYRQFPAPPDLAPWVECLWILRGAMAVEGQAILPDGRVELIFHFGAPPAEQPDTWITGQITEALQLRPRGVMDTLGVRLRPEASALQPFGTWASRAREEAGNSSDRLRTIVRHLRLRLAAATEPDAAVADSIHRIERSGGRGAMDAFVPDGLQMRQWQRRFAAATGLTPKAFARITRLQRVVSLYQSGQWQRWADLALESGFYDQAHLANDFRAFAGQSPDAFFREGRGMAEFYRDGFFQDRRLGKQLRS